MKFLLVIPRFIPSPGRYYSFPLGIAYISGSLKEAGYEVRCLNLNHELGEVEDLIKREIDDFDPDICGCGTLSPFMKLVQRIFKASRKAKPNIINMVGGGVFSGDADLSMRIMDVDIGVFGEGEQAVVEIAQTLESGGDLTEVTGLAVRTEGDNWVKTPARKQTKDLDALAWPDLEGFGINEHFELQTPADDYTFHLQDNPRSIAMISSRSCPFSCTFCYHPIGKVYRERSLDDFFAELDHYVEKYQINQVAILDELFAVKKPRLREFCSRIKTYNIQWTVQLHVSICDEEVIRLMKEAGCIYISYGLESMDPVVLESMKKKASVEQIETAMKLTYDAKIGIQGNFIFGDPAETVDSVNNTLEWWAKHREYQINLAVINLYPGTPLYYRGLQEGKIDNTGEHIPDHLTNLTEMSTYTLGVIREMLRVFHYTLLLPAKVLSFELDGPAHIHRGDRYKISWECPRCEETNTYRNVYFDNTENFQSVRLTCRHCLSRFDIQNLARSPWTDAEIEEWCAQADALKARGVASRNGRYVREAAELYKRAVEKNYPLSLTDRPDAFVHAATQLADIFKAVPDEGDDLTYYYSGEALIRKGFDPQFHFFFAQSLINNGMTGAALAHLEQALMLIPEEAQGNEGLVAVLENFRGVIKQMGQAGEKARFVA